MLSGSSFVRTFSAPLPRVRPSAVSADSLAGACAAGGSSRLQAPSRTRQARRRTTYGLVIDRKSVVKGKSVSVRVALGGRRIIKKKSFTNLHTIANYTTIGTDKYL